MPAAATRLQQICSQARLLSEAILGGCETERCEHHGHEQCEANACDRGNCCNGRPFDKTKYACCKEFSTVPGGVFCDGDVEIVQTLRKIDNQEFICPDPKAMLEERLNKCYGEDENDQELDETDRCDSGEVWVDRLPRCEKTCRELLYAEERKCRDVDVSDSDLSVSGCTCDSANNYYRNTLTGECVLMEACPVAENEDNNDSNNDIGDVVEICVGRYCCGPSRLPYDAELDECCQDGSVALKGQCVNAEVECGENQVYDTCVNPCSGLTCGKIRDSCRFDKKWDIALEDCRAMCVCKPNYILNDEGRCILMSDCEGIGSGFDDIEEAENKIIEISDDLKNLARE